MPSVIILRLVVMMIMCLAVMIIMCLAVMILMWLDVMMITCLIVMMMWLVVMMACGDDNYVACCYDNVSCCDDNHVSCCYDNVACCYDDNVACGDDNYVACCYDNNIMIIISETARKASWTQAGVEPIHWKLAHVGSGSRVSGTNRKMTLKFGLNGTNQTKDGIRGRKLAAKKLLGR